MKYYDPKHFKPEEYVPPEIYKELGDKSILLIDYRILKTDDAIREHFGKPVLINNWHTGGNRIYSGFRPEYVLFGAKYSQHRYGRASDKIIPGLDINEVRKEILQNQKHFPYITVMEDDVNWLHTDCRCIVDSTIQLIKP